MRFWPFKKKEGFALPHQLPCGGAIKASKAQGVIRAVAHCPCLYNPKGVALTKNAISSIKCGELQQLCKKVVEKNSEIALQINTKERSSSNRQRKDK
jgi:hypothetical protein